MIDMMARRDVQIAGGVALIATLFLSSCGTPREATPDEGDAPIPVAVAPVTMAEIADTFEAGGIVQAQTTATITARILAPVREVRAAPGDRVRAGQLLVVLDGRDLAAYAQGARAAAAAADQAATAAVSEQQAADSALTLARTTHERLLELHAKRSATDQELDEATAVLRAAEAHVAGAAARVQASRSEVERARARSEAAGTTESFAQITAPFDGVVTDKMVEPGNMAAPGTPLMRLEDTHAFRLDVRVDESRIGYVSPGTAVPVSLDSGTGGTTTTVEGTVAEIGRAIDADARAFLVKIALPEIAPPGAGTLRSGRFGRAHFSGLARRALTVPADALVHHGQVTSVFVVENGVARVRLVNVSGTEVLAGLSEAEVVIVGAPPAVTDGSRVTEGNP